MRVSVAPLTSPEIAYAVRRPVWEHGVPDIPFASRAGFFAGFDLPPPGYVVERYVGLLDDEPVGYLELSIPQLDNLDNLLVEVEVLPSARRHGVGRAMFRVATDRTAALGRKHIIGATVDSHPDGAAFAAAVGAVAGLEETRSRLDVTTLDETRLAELLADAWRHAEGYHAIQWTGVPPDEVIDDVAYLEGRLLADSPTGSLDLEPDKVDAERIRQVERVGELRGRASYHAGALHGDRLVAWTAMVGEVALPVHAWQHTTLVDPDHRGHRLGMLVKLVNLAQIRELRPGLEAIDTFNASENEHMLRINRAMGFRPADIWTDWQKDL